MTTDTFKYKEFDKLTVSVRTVICNTNITLNTKNIFDNLFVTKYEIKKKKRGRKPKNSVEQKENPLPDGSIIQLRYGNNVKGIQPKEKKNYFRNSLSVVMFIQNKKINVKLPKTGNVQMTGCKTLQQAQKAMIIIWDKIKSNSQLYSFNDKQTKFQFIIIPSMCNIDFNLNFLVDRQQLDQYFNENTPYYSLLETNFGHTGVNIKIPFDKSIQELPLKKIIISDNNIITKQQITYNDYLDTLSTKDKLKKINKRRFNTFLVFHSGSVIMSGIDLYLMRDTYNVFLNIIKNCKSFIIEKLH